jgi:NADPH:quinone reductase-like Zn-dependent oxidoreductase
MKAIVYHQYGSPEVLRLQEVDRPAVRDHEVLVRVKATSLNGSDWEGLRGKPLYARIAGPLKPTRTILGSDIAGLVETTGGKVTRFKPGDAVFGDILTYMGGLAEYARAPESALVAKPAGLTFEQAAAIPQSGVIALQGIRDKGKVQPGQKVLINGAGGGAGSFAVQLAKLYGAEVTGVDNAGKLDFMRALGADHVIDYARSDFTATGAGYDLILDTTAARSVFDYARALNPNGRGFFVGGSVATLFQILLVGPFVGRNAGKRIRILVVRPNIKDLAFVADLCVAGKIVPAIDRQYRLSEAPDALRYLGAGHAKGKVVVTIE